MTNKVISICNYDGDSVLVGEMEVAHISWSEAPHKGHVKILNVAGRILAVLTPRCPTLHFAHPLESDYLRFSGLGAGIIQVYLRGESTSGH